MKKTKININSIYDIVIFVQYASKVNGDINVYCDNKKANGASLMSMMTLDFNKDLIVEYPETAFAFESFISNFII